MVKTMAKIGMIGAGSWGTALTWLLTNNGHQVTVWSALADEITMLQEKHEQTSKLPGVILDDSVVFTTDLKAAVEGMDLLVLAVPSPFTRSTAHQLKDVAAQGQIIVNVAKGVEENTLMTLSQIIEEEVPQAEVAVLSGPSHAEEVGKGIPTTIVVGSKKKEIAQKPLSLVRSLLRNRKNRKSRRCNSHQSLSYTIIRRCRCYIKVTTPIIWTARAS